MTENLLQKLEEKMMMVLAEVEELRKEIRHLNHENSLLRMERETHSKKLQDLISLLDAINVAEQHTIPNTTMMGIKPTLVQG